MHDEVEIVPQTRWTEQWEPAQRAWAAGRKVVKLIGFECDEEHRLCRADAKAHAGKGKLLRGSKFFNNETLNRATI